MQLAPNLYRVGSDLVNLYLVGDDAGLTLVDTGMPGNYRDLQAELARLGRSLSDIRGVVLTHGDPDHTGFAERLRRETGVPVYVHEADAARARGEAKKQLKWGKVRVGPLLRFMAYGLRRGGLSASPVDEVVGVTDGQVLDLPGSPRIIHIPGHTPGSAAVWFESVGALMVGDALTTGHVLTGEQGPRPAPFTLDPSGAMASLARIEDLPAEWLLPGHGAPWQGEVREAVEQVRREAARA
jgi:glyoxylase-like metal-dependent hydrolase (beta-lactamase superfamily II)